MNPAKQLTSDPLLARMEPGEVYRLEELVEATAMAPVETAAAVDGT